MLWTKDISSSLITEPTDIISDNETPSVEYDINLNDNDDIFFDDENNIVTDVTDFSVEEEVIYLIYTILK